MAKRFESKIFVLAVVVIVSWFPIQLAVCTTTSSNVSHFKKCCEINEYLNLEEGSWVCQPFLSSASNKNLTNLRSDWEIFIQQFGFERSSVAKIEEFHLKKLISGRPYCLEGTKIIQTLSPQDVNINEGTDDWILFPEQQSTDLNSSGNYYVVTTKDDFCIDWTEKKSVFVELCIPNCSESLCVRKCCLPNQLVDMNTFSCVEVNSRDNWWLPQPHSHYTMKQFTLQDTIIRSLHPNAVIMQPQDSDNNNNIINNKKSRVTHTGQPICHLDSYEVDFRDKEKYKRLSLLRSGHLLIDIHPEYSEYGKMSIISWDKFCIDGIASTETEKNLNSQKYNQIALVCFDSEDIDEIGPENKDVLRKYRETLYVVLTGISSIFLLCTSIIYIILWKDLRLPGWLQFSYTNSLLIAFSLLTIIQIWTNQIHQYSNQLCRVIGYTLHASFLSCFFWLTSMNIDLWCSFRNSSITSGFGRTWAKRRYFGFAIFSISIPLAVTLTGVIVDNSPRIEGEEKGIWMEIGNERCGLDIGNKLAQLYYFYVVVGLLLLLNLIFFFCTVLCLRERQKETKFAHRQCTASDSDLKRFRLFTRLFFIMGVLWIFELISWLTGYLELRWEVQLIFIVTDCLNALQGVAIFLMFVWKRQTWRQLRKKFGIVLKLESQTSLMSPNNTNKSSVKSSIKSDQRPIQST